MVTKEQVESLSLNIPTDTETLILVENALNWIASNTSVEVDKGALNDNTAGVKLFILKYIGVMQLPDGITSESASGLSQSFGNVEKNDLILQIARSIFGEDELTAGKVRFVAAQNPWA